MAKREISETCPNPDCGRAVDWSDEKCGRCKQVLAVPNQRELLVQDEKASLNGHYQQAVEKATQQGHIDSLRQLEAKVKADSHAVINVSPQLLDDFLAGSKTLMSNYVLQVAAKTRKPAKRQDDKTRSGVEGILFGSYAKQIRYAALSLTHQGLTSYGECSITLADVTMEKSATVMIENSFDFIKRHRITPMDAIPAGMRSTWTDRHLLATTKLVDKLADGQNGFEQWLLNSEGDRNTDEFVEVHIYGEFGQTAIEVIAIPKLKKQKQLRQSIVAHANELNIEVIHL